MKTIIIALVLVLVFSANAFCHSPADITAVINNTVVDLIVSHSVSDPNTHYVKRVEVKLNAETAAEREFSSQTDDMTQKTSLDIPSMKKGDVLSITAYCSRYGDLAKNITVE
jgi:hypothetical protein